MPTRNFSSAGRHLGEHGKKAGRVAALAVCAAACATAAPSALADGGAAAGGTAYVPQPEVKKVLCVSRCASHRRPRAGSTIVILGKAFVNASRVVFNGGGARRDDVPVRTRALSPRKIRVRVPLGAVAGPLTVHASRTVKSPPSRPLPILPPPPPVPNPELSPVPGSPLLETGTSRTKVFSGARRAVTFSYRLAEPMGVTVELVRVEDGVVAGKWDHGAVAAGRVREVVWSGTGAPGRYAFLLTARGATGSSVQSARNSDLGVRDSFDLYDHMFPVRGRHHFGGAGARFGSGRSGHSHQGHDLFAACGTPMVAARGGKIQYAGYHGAAGNYVVIDGAGTGTDYAYMHLAQPTPFRKGDKVFTGQQIGAVGQTGNARGCHLHFELWGSPGWYQGGRPVDPLPSLQAWDSWS